MEIVAIKFDWSEIDLNDLNTIFYVPWETTLFFF